MIYLPCWVHGYFLSQKHLNALNWTLSVQCPGRYEDDLLHLIDKGIRECEDKAAWQMLTFLTFLATFFMFFIVALSIMFCNMCVCVPFESCPLTAINALWYVRWRGKSAGTKLSTCRNATASWSFCSWYLFWLNSNVFYSPSLPMIFNWLTYFFWRWNHQLDPVIHHVEDLLQLLSRHAEGIAVMIDQEQKLWKCPKCPR